MEKKRKPYTKPMVEGVYLLPDEAVLADCKAAGSSGPSGGTCGIDQCVSVLAS